MPPRSHPLKQLQFGQERGEGRDRFEVGFRRAAPHRFVLVIITYIDVKCDGLTEDGDVGEPVLEEEERAVVEVAHVVTGSPTQLLLYIADWFD